MEEKKYYKIYFVVMPDCILSTDLNYKDRSSKIDLICELDLENGYAKEISTNITIPIVAKGYQSQNKGLTYPTKFEFIRAYATSSTYLLSVFERYIPQATHEEVERYLTDFEGDISKKSLVTTLLSNLNYNKIKQIDNDKKDEVKGPQFSITNKGIVDYRKEFRHSDYALLMKKREQIYTVPSKNKASIEMSFEGTLEELGNYSYTFQPNVIRWGEYPQSLVRDSSIKKQLKRNFRDNNLDKTGKKYDTWDGEYLDEYILDGEKYVRGILNFTGNCKLDEPHQINFFAKKDKEVWFKVEPVLWIIKKFGNSIKDRIEKEMSLSENGVTIIAPTNIFPTDTLKSISKSEYIFQFRTKNMHNQLMKDTLKKLNPISLDELHNIPKEKEIFNFQKDLSKNQDEKNSTYVPSVITGEEKNIPTEKDILKRKSVKAISGLISSYKTLTHEKKYLNDMNRVEVAKNILSDEIHNRLEELREYFNVSNNDEHIDNEMLNLMFDIENEIKKTVGVPTENNDLELLKGLKKQLLEKAEPTEMSLIFDECIITNYEGGSYKALLEREFDVMIITDTGNNQEMITLIKNANNPENGCAYQLQKSKLRGIEYFENFLSRYENKDITANITLGISIENLIEEYRHEIDAFRKNEVLREIEKEEIRKSNEREPDIKKRLLNFFGKRY